MANITLEVAKKCVGKGWHPLLEQFYDAANSVENVVVLQVKEKFGGLRLYWSHNHPMSADLLNPSKDVSLHELVDRLEAESLTLCEYCGAPENQLMMVPGLERCACHVG